MLLLIYLVQFFRSNPNISLSLSLSLSLFRSLPPFTTTIHCAIKLPSSLFTKPSSSHCRNSLCHPSLFLFLSYQSTLPLPKDDYTVVEIGPHLHWLFGFFELEVLSPKLHCLGSQQRCSLSQFLLRYFFYFTTLSFWPLVWFPRKPSEN